MSRPYDPHLIYMKFRGLMEEIHSEAFVEDVIHNRGDNTYITWIRFQPLDLDPKVLASKVLKISKDFNMEIVLFAVGLSHYMCFSASMGSFLKVKKHGQAIPSPSEVERLVIPKTRVLSAIKTLFLEDKRRRLVNADYESEISQSKTDSAT